MRFCVDADLPRRAVALIALIERLLERPEIVEKLPKRLAIVSRTRIRLRPK